MTKIYYSPMRTGSISFQLLLDDALTYVNSDLNNKVVFVTCRGELLPCNNNLIIKIEVLSVLHIQNILKINMLILRSVLLT